MNSCDSAKERLLARVDARRATGTPRAGLRVGPLRRPDSAAGVAAILALAMGGVTPHAHAQQSAQAGGGLDEVIVTARKRDENVQDIPATIDVLDGASLTESGVLRPNELQYAVPGFYVQNYETRATITMRGVGAQIEGGTSAVALHMNGIYQSSASAQLNRLFDIERIEVVKGPQGTLYGRNSTGGAVNIITRKAGDEFDADFSVGYGTYSTVSADAAVSIPLAEDWGLRIAGSYLEGDGIYRNVVTGRDIGNDEFWGARLTLSGKAGGVGVELFAQYARDDDTRNTLIPLIAGTKTPLLAWDQTAHDEPAEPLQERKPLLAGLSLSGEFGEGYTWRSITGYLDYDEGASTTDVNPRPSLPTRLIIEYPQFAQQFSQEFQLLRDGERLDWVLGAYYVDDQQSARRFAVQRPAGLVLFNNRTTNDAEVYALFGDLNYNLTDRLRLNVGARWNREEVRNTQSGTGLLDGTPFDLRGTQGDPTGRIGLDYTIRRGLMVYGTLSNGYLAGGFNPRVDALTGRSVATEVKPEKINAFEAGFKSVLPGERGYLNMAAYYYDYKDMQVTVGGLFLLANGQPDPARPPFFFTDNAAKSRIYGLELQLSELRLSEWFKFDLGAAYLNAKYDEYRSLLPNRTIGIFDDNTMPRSPRFTASSAFTFDNLRLGEAAAGSIRVEYNYRTKTYFTRENIDATSAQDAYGLLNVVAKLDFAEGRWGLQFTGRNLTDEKFYNFLRNDPFANTGEFRTWEVSVNYRYR